MIEFIQSLPTWVAAMPFFIVGIGGLILVWGYQLIKNRPTKVGYQEKGFKEIWKDKDKYNGI